MKVGDLVNVLGRMMGSPIQLGVITKRVKPPTADNWNEIFEVMTSDGKINTYWSNALRMKNESR